MNRRALLAAGSATVATSALALDRPRKLWVGVLRVTAPMGAAVDMPLKERGNTLEKL